MHVTDRDLSLYISAQLAQPQVQWLEHHCEACAPCAERVRAEAQLELQLQHWAKEQRCGRHVEVLLRILPTPSAVPPPVPPLRPMRTLMLFSSALVAVVLLMSSTLERNDASVDAPLTANGVSDAGGSISRLISVENMPEIGIPGGTP